MFPAKPRVEPTGGHAAGPSEPPFVRCTARVLLLALGVAGLGLAAGCTEESGADDATVIVGSDANVDTGAEVGSDVGPAVDVAGDATEDAEVTSGPSVSIEPAEPLTSDDLIASVLSADGSPGGSVSWFRDGEPQAIDGNTVSSDLTMRGQVWRAESGDSSSEGPGAASAEVTIQNTPPSCVWAGLVPQSKAAEPILCTCEGRTDPDGDAAADTCAWTVDDQEVAVTECVLPPNTAAAGQSVRCTITPRDDADAGEPVSSTISVVNSPPGVPEQVLVLPAEPTRVTGATCSAELPPDPDGEVTTAEYRWYQGPLELDSTTDSVPGDALAKGLALRCEVRRSDGEATTEWVSSPAVIVQNTAPQADSVAALPAEAPRGGAFTCTPSGLSDLDPSDDPTLEVVWWLGDAPLPGAISPVLPADELTPGDVVHCVATPTDGDDDGATLTSGSATVINLVPTVAFANVQPPEPSIADAIVCHHPPAVDGDGDPVSVTIEWLINGEPGHPSSIGAGDTIQCIVTPSDPWDDGEPVQSSAVLVATSLCPLGKCDDGSDCTEASCDPLTGACGYAPVGCDDGDPCTTDWCDPTIDGDGCQHTPIAAGVCGTDCDEPVDCQDNDPCTTDTCEGGLCHNVPVDCDDGAICTVDTCTGSVCSHTLLDECTTGCVDDAACADNDPCTTDVCDPLFGTCSNVLDNDCQACDSVADCVPPGGVNHCLVASCPGAEIGEGACQYQPRVCYDSVACTEDGCHPDHGCEFRVLRGCEAGCLTDADCDDGSPCTVELCADGECNHALIPCDDGESCTHDWCDPATGACVHDALSVCNDQGGACSDDADCQTGDACLMATCNGPEDDRRCLYEPINCNDYDSCTTDSCDPASGCVFQPLVECEPGACANTTWCDDDNTCTAEACVANQCSTLCTTHADCDDGDATTLDTCTAGRCGSEPAPACTVDADCADDNACTINRCDEGRCRVRPALCDDQRACTLDRAACGADPADIDPRLRLATCPAGGGQLPACVPEIGCLNLPALNCGVTYYDGAPSLEVACSSDSDCDTGHLCAPGVCDGGHCVVQAVTCPPAGDDVEAYCDPATGACAERPRDNWTGCTSHDDCRLVSGELTGVDHCTIGYCDLAAVAPACLYVAKPCDDADPCTIDSCDPESGCQFAPQPGCGGCDGDAACDDTDPCTSDLCVAGQCHHEPVVGCTSCEIADCAVVDGQLSCVCPPPEPAICPVPLCERDQDCIDESTCTLDRCLPTGHCENAPVECTFAQACAGYSGQCLEGYGCRAVFDGTCSVCDQEGDDCTSCVVDADCPPDPAGSCSPGQCFANECVYAPLACSDFDPCTADSCDSATGTCVFTPIPGCTGCGADADCEDGEVCTLDRCEEGSCVFDIADGCAPCGHDADCPVSPDLCTTVSCNVAVGVCELTTYEDCVSCDPLDDEAIHQIVCNDGLDCTLDVCSPLGICENQWQAAIPGCTPVPCDSHHDCTLVAPCHQGRCDFALGQCVVQAISLAEIPFESCPVTCATDADCFDDDPCTLDRCAPDDALGGEVCHWTPKDCVDGVLCTPDHRCGDGGCEFVTDPGCDAACETDANCATGDPCFDGACVGGQCVITAKPCGGTSCLADSDCAAEPCTTVQCVDQQCIQTALGCDDSNPCTLDSCGQSGCEFTFQAGCTLGCQEDVDCDDDDTNTVDRCDKNLSECTNIYKPPCERDADCWDNNACTWETCDPTGRCTSSPVVCYDALPCTKDLAPCGGALSDLSTLIAYDNCVPEEGQLPACDPTIGCFHLPVLECGDQIVDGKPLVVDCQTDADCATGHLCYPGTCSEGKCHTERVDCPDPGPDKQAYCDWQTGECTTVDFPGWTTCSAHADCRYVDADLDLDPELQDKLRDGYDRCSIAFCDLGSENPQCLFFEKKCNDLNPCTTDSCDLDTGCQFEPVEGCVGCSSSGDCNDLDPCTTDVCEAGECVHELEADCTACTISTESFRCFDGDECTRDICDMTETGRNSNEAGNCQHVPYEPFVKPWCYGNCAFDYECDDGEPCTLDRCNQVAAKCEHPPVECNDGLPCSNNPPCEPGKGCQPDLGGHCIDMPCVTIEDCAGGQGCLHFECVDNACTPTTVPCDDGDPETFDVCDPVTRTCLFQPADGQTQPCQVDSDCDDGNACTTDDCLGGLGCNWSVVNCDDYDWCTTDSCDPGSGCAFEPVPGCTGCTQHEDCDDGNACTDEVCSGGQCTNPVIPGCP